MSTPSPKRVSLAPPSHWFDKFSDDDGGAFIGVVFVLYMATFVYTKQERRQKVISAAGPALKTTRKIDYFNEKFIYSWVEKRSSTHTHEKTLNSYHCIAWAFRTQLPAFLGLAEFWKNKKRICSNKYNHKQHDFLLKKCITWLFKKILKA